MEELKYALKDAFEYAYKGENRKAEFITLSAPTVKNIRYTAKLKQGFMQAIKGQEASATPTPDDKEMPELTGEAIMVMMAMSDVDYAGYMETARAIFTDTDVALIDGEQPLKKVLMMKISVDDLESMTGEYLKVFILTSVSKMMQT